MTNRSASVNVLSKLSGEVKINYGSSPLALRESTGWVAVGEQQPHEFELSSLKQNAATHYQLQFRESPNSAVRALPPQRIQTQRSAGSSFTFTIQGDSHPERPQMSDPNLYARTLQLVAKDQPDFHICMGDDFSIARLSEFTPESVESRYLLQRPFLAHVGQSAPLFLINGNHEQASLYNYNQPGTPHDVAVWAQVARNRHYPLPAPNGFFTGNSAPLKEIGQMRDYYAWTWGDALLIVLDSYWHSPVSVDTQLGEDDAGGKKRNSKDRDFWDITIGDAQYAWLTKTLETSNAKYKFVFTHHLLGTGRGGVERASLFEWGGKSQRGIDEFNTRRPGWDLPIHQLMVKHGVNAFFQGHDHLYAMQELDGIVYQTVPIPADASYSIYNEDRYASGIKHPNSGYLRVHVDPRETKVQYVRSFSVGEANRHGEIAHEYSIKARA